MFCVEFITRFLLFSFSFFFFFFVFFFIIIIYYEILRQFQFSAVEIVKIIYLLKKKESNFSLCVLKTENKKKWMFLFTSFFIVIDSYSINWMFDFYLLIQYTKKNYRLRFTSIPISLTSCKCLFVGVAQWLVTLLEVKERHYIGTCR